MSVKIYSRKAMEDLLSKGNIKKTAIISFHDPIGRGRRSLEDYQPIDFMGKCDRVMQIELHDLDPEALADFDLTKETYFPEADKLAEFIYKAKDEGFASPQVFADGEDLHACRLQASLTRSARQM